jgi:hypothetical protein
LHAALRDSRVRALLLINLQVVVWESGLTPARDLRALRSQPLSLSRLRRVATPRRVRAFARWMLAAPLRWVQRMITGQSPSAAAEGQVDHALERLLASGTRAVWLFTNHEPLYGELVRSGWKERLAGSPNMTFAHIDVRDHTMRPGPCQRELHAALDRAVELELERAAAPALPSRRRAAGTPSAAQ